MKSIRLKDRIQNSRTNDEMYWLNRILSWSFDHPDWVLVLVWGLYTLLDFMTMWVMGWEIDLGFALRNLVFGFSLSVMMYYWIFPKILISKEWKSGILMGGALVILLSTVKFYLRFPGELFWKLSFAEIWMEWLRIIQFQGLTFSIWITLAHILLSKDFKKKNEQFEELHFQYQALQVEPHFVLNMLSGISFSAKKLSKELSVEIQQFSTVLKYGYKDHRNQNSLLDEITAIEAYSFCQRSRFGDSLNLVTHIVFEEEIVEMLPIPKMVLLSLFADLFKHGEYEGKFPCKVDLVVNRCSQSGNVLLCFAVFNLVSGRKNENSGFGLSAVQNLLGYYFEDDFHIFFQQVEDEFSLLLTIDYGY